MRAEPGLELQVGARCTARVARLKASANFSRGSHVPQARTSAARRRARRTGQRAAHGHATWDFAFPRLRLFLKYEFNTNNTAAQAPVYQNMKYDVAAKKSMFSVTWVLSKPITSVMGRTCPHPNSATTKRLAKWN